jgi:hypothetical protein
LWLDDLPVWTNLRSPWLLTRRCPVTWRLVVNPTRHSLQPFRVDVAPALSNLLRPTLGELCSPFLDLVDPHLDVATPTFGALRSTVSVLTLTITLSVNASLELIVTTL